VCAFLHSLRHAARQLKPALTICLAQLSLSYRFVSRIDQYGAIDAQSSSRKKQLSLRDARVLAHMHSNRSLSFTVANVRDLSSTASSSSTGAGAMLSIQFAGESNADTDAWRAAIQSVIDAAQCTPWSSSSSSQQQGALFQVSAPSPSPAALRWQAFHAAAKKWAVRPPPSRATLNIRLDKVLREWSAQPADFPRECRNFPLTTH
jgi:hypothetical protein